MATDSIVDTVEQTPLPPHLEKVALMLLTKGILMPHSAFRSWKIKAAGVEPVDIVERGRLHINLKTLEEIAETYPAEIHAIKNTCDERIILGKDIKDTKDTIVSLSLRRVQKLAGVSPVTPADDKDLLTFINGSRPSDFAKVGEESGVVKSVIVMLEDFYATNRFVERAKALGRITDDLASLLTNRVTRDVLIGQLTGMNRNKSEGKMVEVLVGRFDKRIEEILDTFVGKLLSGPSKV